MQKREYLDLTTEKGNRFYFRTESLNAGLRRIRRISRVYYHYE